MMFEEKVWGSVRHIFDGPVSASLLRVNSKAYCSIHKHKQRWNYFFVVSGRIRIVFYCDDCVTISRILVLGPKESIAVAPQQIHRFEVIESGRVVEIYWTNDGSEVQYDDIVRYADGGVFCASNKK